MVAHSEGMELVVEPRVGGRVVAQPGNGWVFDYEPPRLLRFSAADPTIPAHVEGAKKTWTISWELTPDRDGTRVVFIHRFLRGDQCESAEAIESLERASMSLCRNLTADSAIQLRRVDILDATHAAASVAQCVARGLTATAERRNDTEASDRYAGGRHEFQISNCK